MTPSLLNRRSWVRALASANIQWIRCLLMLGLEPSKDQCSTWATQAFKINYLKKQLSWKRMWQRQETLSLFLIFVREHNRLFVSSLSSIEETLHPKDMNFQQRKQINFMYNKRWTRDFLYKWRGIGLCIRCLLCLKSFGCKSPKWRKWARNSSSFRNNTLYTTRYTLPYWKD